MRGLAEKICRVFAPSACASLPARSNDPLVEQCRPNRTLQHSLGSPPGLLYSTQDVPRFFNILEAEGLLPEVQRIVRGLLEFKNEFDEAADDLNLIAQRITIMGGMIPPHDQVVLLRNRKNAAARATRSAVDQLRNTGCQLKDLESGRVNFPTLYHGQEVYLCWKVGDTGIGFWHHLDDGDRDRQVIDSEFLKNHRGEE